MSTQKKTIKVFMFLLPALITLLGYAAFHDILFKEPPCLINCNTPSPFSDNEKFKKWLAFLDSLRDNPFASNPSRRGSSPTALDLAFLQDKFDATHQHGDYFQRYRQIIDDLTSPIVVKEITDERTAPVQIAQLSAPGTANDINGQVFVGTSAPANDDIADPTFLVRPTGAQRNNGPYFINPDNNQPPIAGGGTSNGGDNNSGNNGSGGNNGGTGGNGGQNGGGEAPSTGGSNPSNGGGNPISTVPVPKSVYLLLGMVLLIAIRFKLSQRTFIQTR